LRNKFSGLRGRRRLPKQVLTIAVRELVEFVCRSGDLNREFFGSRRLAEAIRAHQTIQRSRPPHYRAEVPVAQRLETERFVLNLGGRIDGVYPAAAASGPAVIEEIKTLSREFDTLSDAESALHWAQAKVYAHMYAVEHGHVDMAVELTYYHLDSHETRQERRTFAREALAEFFTDVTERYLHWAGIWTDWLRLRDETIRRVEFPFAAYRPGQRSMAVAVYRSIQNGGRLIAQAPTGIGKTMAALFPAVKALTETPVTKIFYLTARTTVRTVAEKALGDLRRAGLRFKSLTLTAKDKVCFTPDGNCSPEACEYAAGYYDRLREALPRAFERDALTREWIEAVAGEFRLCPFELSLELTRYADGIVCDYNYAFDPRVYLRHFFLEPSGPYVFLIDEAHNLVDRSREMFSADIRKQVFLDLRRGVKQELPALYRSLGRINRWLADRRKICRNSPPGQSDERPPDTLLPLLRLFLKQAEQWLARNRKTAFREDLLQLYFAVSAFVLTAERFDEAYRTCYTVEGKDLQVKLFCVDPSVQLADALDRCRAAVFFSATLTPAAYFKQMFGCEAATPNLSLPSPFPQDNFAVFVAHRISTFYKDRVDTAAAISRQLAALAGHKKGNYLLYFPSHVYLQMIYEHFRSERPDIQTLCQAPSMDENQRREFLERFSADNAETLVGFAVMGGIFGEGIDLVGDRLTAAAVIGVGLPGISLETELIREHFDRRLNAGFDYAYLFPGINRVLQAAGRVIRSETDRGVVLLIDRRFDTHRYRTLLPSHWRPVRVDGTRSLAEALRSFWSRFPD
jgi:DNA excision repair protein ERCC-2